MSLLWVASETNVELTHEGPVCEKYQALSGDDFYRAVQEVYAAQGARVVREFDGLQERLRGVNPRVLEWGVLCIVAGTSKAAGATEEQFLERAQGAYRATKVLALIRDVGSLLELGKSNSESN